MNMRKWMQEVMDAPRKKAFPVLSFPAVQLMGITVAQLVYDSDLQAKAMKLVADRCDSLASVSMMDLSVEAEAFGSQIHVSDDEVPTVLGSIVVEPEDAEALQVPQFGAARTGVYVEAIKKAVELITDRPVFAGVIGPYSLAGRLMGMNEIFFNCFDEPEMVKLVLDKCTAFIIEYIKAYKAVGAHGVVVAEPAAGLLSAEMMEEFSAPYMKRIVDAVQDDEFALVYHNCGNSTTTMTEEMYAIGAMAYHFGDAVDMKFMCDNMPEDVLVMGNVSPSKTFQGGTPESMRAETLDIMEKCCVHKNFVISSGCDIPPESPWENIDAFYAAVEEYYEKH